MLLFRQHIGQSIWKSSWNILKSICICIWRKYKYLHLHMKNLEVFAFAFKYFWKYLTPSLASPFLLEHKVRHRLFHFGLSFAIFSTAPQSLHPIPSTSFPKFSVLKVVKQHHLHTTYRSSCACTFKHFSFVHKAFSWSSNTSSVFFRLYK